MSTRLSAGYALLVSTLLASCGGGGGSDSPPPPPAVAAPTGLSYATPQNLRVNTAMTAITPSVTGTVAGYAVSPALPAGLSLNATSGQISGTPTANSAAATYTVSASNAGGTTTFALSLKVYGVDVQSQSIARFAAQGSPINADVIVRPVNFNVGTLYATATDASGVILSTVDVIDRGDGTFTLRLSTNPASAPATFAGNVTLNLCKDPACATAQDVPSVSVPFSVRVLAPATAWPGDNTIALSAWAGAPDWTTTQGNAAHTGFVPVTADPDKFTTRWKTAGNYIWNPWTTLKQNLVTANGLFYVVSSDHTQNGVVYAKRESDGTEAWHYTVDNMSWPAASPVSISNNVVYFAAGHQSDTFLIARNATDGSPIYRAPVTSQWEHYFPPTIGPTGMLYANAGTYGGLYGLDAQGNQLFFVNEAQQSNWTPAVNATGVYAYTGGQLQIVDPLSGAQTLSIADPMYQNYVYEVGGAPVLGDAALGSVFAAPYTNASIGTFTTNYLTNFRTLAGGSIAWQIQGRYPSTPAYKNGVVYAVNQAPLRLEARAEADGALLWSWAPVNAAETKFVSEVVVTNNLAIVSTDYATHVIDLATHRSVWNYPAFGTLAVSANGVLYIHNVDNLVAINLK
ncbi:MAG TPA: putative Ig domain-containing protein [Steroidobacteraceae bacterium]|nr:putative Ig domain-containing protein [Steroidobacteraceae bacterium]